MDIAENLKIVNEKMRISAEKSGRAFESVKLMAVSKFHPAVAVIEAIEAGQLLFGENRVQEASEKFPQIFEKYPSADMHLIGSLQSNKVKNAVKIASCIQSVDRISLLDEIEKQCAKIEKKIEILFELHTGEDSKSGFENALEMEKALDYCYNSNCPHIIPSGFMTMAPFTDDKDKIRRSFATLKNEGERLRAKFPQFPLNEFSMGMSGDFEIAIEEGSTLIRVGTAIFGQRVY